MGPAIAAAILRARHGTRLPDADRRHLRPGDDGRARAGRRRLTLLARLWYVAGGLLAGVGADLLGFGRVIALVAGLTAASGIWLGFELGTEDSPTTERAPSVDSAAVGHG